MDLKPDYVCVDVKKNVTIHKSFSDMYDTEDIQQRTLVSTKPTLFKSGNLIYGQIFTSNSILKHGLIYIGRSVHDENKMIFQNQLGEIMQTEYLVSITILDIYIPERIKHTPIPQNILKKLSDADRMKKEHKSFINQINQELSSTTENSLFSNFFKK